jgi:hypothetical protein
MPPRLLPDARLGIAVARPARDDPAAPHLRRQPGLTTSKIAIHRRTCPLAAAATVLLAMPLAAQQPRDPDTAAWWSLIGTLASGDMRFLHQISVRPSAELPRTVEAPVVFRGYCGCAEVGPDVDGKVVLCFGGRRRGMPVGDERLEAVRVAGGVGLINIDEIGFTVEPSGSDPSVADEVVVVDAHLDGYGFGEAVGGDSLCNGAFDDAAYVATLIRVAQAREGTRLPSPRPARRLHRRGEGASWLALVRGASHGAARASGRRCAAELRQVALRLGLLAVPVVAGRMLPIGGLLEGRLAP